MSTSNKPAIIGLSGTNGSGKDSLGIGLEKYGYFFVSVTDFLREELKAQNLPITRDNMRRLSTKQRLEHGGGYLIEKAVDLWRKDQPDAKGVVIASLRDPQEVKTLHELGGVMVWIDADPQVRYQRIQDNLVLRGRAEEDSVSFEQFLDAEQAELRPSEDASSSLDMVSVKENSDIFLTNDYPDVDSFVTYAADKLGL